MEILVNYLRDGTEPAEHTTLIEPALITADNLGEAERAEEAGIEATARWGHPGGSGGHPSGVTAGYVSVSGTAAVRLPSPTVPDAFSNAHAAKTPASPSLPREAQHLQQLEPDADLSPRSSPGSHATRSRIPPQLGSHRLHSTLPAIDNPLNEFRPRRTPAPQTRSTRSDDAPRHSSPDADETRREERARQLQAADRGALGRSRSGEPSARRSSSAPCRHSAPMPAMSSCSTSTPASCGTWPCWGTSPRSSSGHGDCRWTVRRWWPRWLAPASQSCWPPGRSGSRATRITAACMPRAATGPWPVYRCRSRDASSARSRSPFPPTAPSTTDDRRFMATVADLCARPWSGHDSTRRCGSARRASASSPTPFRRSPG